MAMAEDPIRTDICIIGAGPAGVAASIKLAESGIPHVLADAAVFPRNKPCGDILTSGVIRVLQQLAPEILPGLLEKGHLNPIWQSLIYPPGGKAIALDFKPFNGVNGEASCYAISRYTLDSALIDKVRRNPMVDFKESFRIKSLEMKEEGVILQADQGQTILARLVILATGSGSQLPAKAGLPVQDEDCAIGIRAHFENTQWPEEKTALFLHPATMPGGLYITPLPNGHCNVNLVLSLRKVKKEKSRLREIFEEQMASVPELKDCFAGARLTGNPEGSRLFLGLRRRKASTNRVMLAGDAAGLIEFFSGNGIPQAYGSGMLAAEIAREAILRGDCSAAFLQQYDQRLQQKFQTGGFARRFLFSLLHHSFAGGWLLRFLSFLAARPQTNFLLRDLLYSPHPAAMLRRPAFWYRLFFEKQAKTGSEVSFRTSAVKAPGQEAETVSV